MPAPELGPMPTPEQVNAAMSGIDARLGLTITEIAEGRLAGTIDADSRHHQPYGIVHGGVYCLIVETLGSLAGGLHVPRDGSAVVGVNNNTDFLRAHRTGLLTAVATPVHLGRLQHLWQVEVTREDGKVCARGQLRLQVLPPGREIAGATAHAKSN